MTAGRNECTKVYRGNTGEMTITLSFYLGLQIFVIGRPRGYRISRFM